MVPKGIVLHLTASRFGDAAQIDQWHKENGWSGIGYHRVIMNGIRNSGNAYNVALDGVIQMGRADNVMGAHCKAKGMNQCTLGITCVGTPSAVPVGAEKAPAKMTSAPYLTAKQFEALVNAAARLCIRYGLNPAGKFKHPTTGVTHPVITQHSQHEPGKPSCASLKIDNVRQAIVTEFNRLTQESVGGLESLAEDEISNELPDAESVEVGLPEFGATGGLDGPQDLDTDVPSEEEGVPGKPEVH